jgi:hypothetical protein
VLSDEHRHLNQLDPCEIDLVELGDIRTGHETDFAKKAVRTGTLKDEPIITVSDGDPPLSAHLARHKLVKRMHEALKSLEDKVGAGTGAIRRLHYEGKVDSAPAGNSANASAAANQRNSAVSDFLAIPP